MKINRKLKAPIPETVDAAAQSKGILPEVYHVAALRERRLLMALRTVSIAALSALVMNIVLGLIIFSMMPLKEVRPFLVRIVDEGSVLATIQPIQETFDAKDILTEKLVREYVTSRHEILRSNDAMTARWGPTNGFIAMTSAEDEYRRFIASVTDTLQDVRRVDGQVTVSVSSVVPITAGRSYVVDLKITTYDERDNIVSDLLYTATVEVQFRPRANLTRNQMLVNPTGFTVTSYTLAEKTQ